MGKRNLRFGYTTGACAAAAAKGAALMLSRQKIVDEVEIVLPRGERVRFSLNGQTRKPFAASCFVVKDAGDDPDVTNGAEIHATVDLNPASPPFQKGGSDFQIIIEGGVGIGRVTKPGLALPVGEWAINPVPRMMIATAVLEVFAQFRMPVGESDPPPLPHVVISIPNGEELARKTLNARLGIVGGLSILGTTGIVKPVSAAAWTDTIDAAIDVALACGSETVVLSTGRTSELAAQRFFALNQQSSSDGRDLVPCALCPVPAAGSPFPEEAYIMMGDHVGHALRACSAKGVKHLILAAQFAKLLKIACGHEQTHVSSSGIDLHTLAEWLTGSPRTRHLVQFAAQAASAREVLEKSGNGELLVKLVSGKAADFAAGIARSTAIQVFLAGYGGEVLYFG
jgi:cobalt-precorrin-5B (C1)-methyltransferase